MKLLMRNTYRGAGERVPTFLRRMASKSAQEARCETAQGLSYCEDVEVFGWQDNRYPWDALRCARWAEAAWAESAVWLVMWFLEAAR